jgi:hypothetical protein
MFISYVAEHYGEEEMQSNLKVFMANISVESVEKPQNS